MTALDEIKREIHKVVIGQDRVIEEVLISVLAGGHSLIEGVPGLAKTLLVKTVAQVLGLSFSRIQFTPDLMPSDITGTDILQEKEGKREFTFIKGPIFANLVLADEINRAPPKTQAALLQGMQEKEVTYSGRTYELPQPFSVLATQNPIEQEGTYPLPEAQLDRFMFYIKIEYPSKEEEIEIIKKTTSPHRSNPQKVLEASEINRIQQEILKMPVKPSALEKTVELIRRTRPSSSDLPIVKNFVEWGAGTRAAQFLILAGKTVALLKEKNIADWEDIEQFVFPVLRHRIIPNFSAQAEGIKVDDIISSVLKSRP